MYRDNCYERNDDFYMTDINIDINNDTNINNSNINMPDYNMNTNFMNPPIIEPKEQRILNRTFIHEVPHVCPIETKIINHHIFRHTYQPAYSCCEENVCTEEQCGSCQCSKYR